MKLYSLLIFALLLKPDKPIVSDDKMEGIGRFKVGKATLSLVRTIAAETKKPVELVDAIAKLDESTASQIVEIKSNPGINKAGAVPLKTPLCSNVRVFYLNSYREDDVELKSVHLFFENDVLVKFTCYASSQLNKALESKYGQPDANIIKLYSDCNWDAKSFVLTWPSDSVSATLSLLVSYDSNCQKTVSQEFSIALKDKEGQLERCEGIAKGQSK